jgi:hypothetical protein
VRHIFSTEAHKLYFFSFYFYSEGNFNGNYGINAVPNITHIQNISPTATKQSVPNPSQKLSTLSTTITSTTTSITTTNTAVTVDAITGSNPKVHTIPRRTSADKTNTPINKPSSRKSSQASATSNQGIAFC